jgi:nitroimidazol reductase NimA-like FMN-containing flavoprotein (pyridoxamine 5'-phosphate oxidase superfamily)
VPVAERLAFPEGYGETARTLSWAHVQAQLEAAKQYWLVANRPGGSPHAVPVDGLWLDDALYYGGSPETAHVRLVRSDPHVTVHLPDPWQVVVVQGEARWAQISPQLARRLADLAIQKYPDYGIEFDASTYSEAVVLRPRRAIAWSSFPTDATRFTFTDSGS